MPLSYKTELHRYTRYYQSLERVVSAPQNRSYTSAIFSFLAISLFGWYAIRPTLQTILTLRREIADNTFVNAQMEEKIRALIEAHTTYQSVAADLPSVSQALPPAPEVLSVLEQIRNIAALRGASVSALTSSAAPLVSREERMPTTPNVPKVTPRRTVKSVQISATLTGTYSALEGVIEDVLSLRRIVTVGTLTFTPDTQTQQQPAFGSAALKLVMQMNAHYIESE